MFIDGGMGGCVNFRMCGLGDVWIGGCVDVWIGGCVDVRIFGCVDWGMCGCADVWIDEGGDVGQGC